MSKVETLDYLSAARRFIRAAGRRVADADEIELRGLMELRAVLDDAIGQAVDGQLSQGRSWAWIASASGETRQAASQRHKRWQARA